MASARTGKLFKGIKKNTWRDWRFCAICLAFPILQFVLTWLFVNIGAVTMAFKRYYLWGDWEWCGLDQFRRVIDDLLHSSVNTTGVGWLNNPRVELAQFFRLRRGNDFYQSAAVPAVFVFSVQKNAARQYVPRHFLSAQRHSHCGTDAGLQAALRQHLRLYVHSDEQAGYEGGRLCLLAVLAEHDLPVLYLGGAGL